MNSGSKKVEIQFSKISIQTNICFFLILPLNHTQSTIGYIIFAPFDIANNKRLGFYLYFQVIFKGFQLIPRLIDLRVFFAIYPWAEILISHVLLLISHGPFNVFRNEIYNTLFKCFLTFFARFHGRLLQHLVFRSTPFVTVYHRP